MLTDRWNYFCRWSPLALAWAVLAIAGTGVAQTDRKMTNTPRISYTFAPWDGPAYELFLPLGQATSTGRPYIRVDIWGNPVFAKETTLALTGRIDPSGSGRASYHLGQDGAAPRVLTGTVRFDALQRGMPVSGDFNLLSADGQSYTGKFTAEWGNKSPLDVIK